MKTTSPLHHQRRTKIVATIGPATSTVDTLCSLLVAGLDVARLNLAHGNSAEHAATIANLRTASRQTGKIVGILIDLPGPKDRTGRLKNGVIDLKTGSEFILTTRPVAGDARRVSVGLPSLARDVHPGVTIYLNDGAIRLRVISTNNFEVRCRVEAGGPLGEHKGVNVPGVTFSSPSITPEDHRGLDFGLAHGVDFIGLSFVRQAEDVARIKSIIEKQRARPMVIAKIEKGEALENIQDILEVADGAMVARGDLGIEIPLERVPLAQKDIIQRCNRLGKPVIVATQMLESMVNAPRPTRAEVTDVANAIFDGTDAVMLSQETSVGKYPVESLQTMSRIAVETEKALPYRELLLARGRELRPETDDAISYAACQVAEQTGAAAIIAHTSSGSTARRVSRYRPAVPIIGLTPREEVARKLQLSWGVRARLMPNVRSITALLEQGRAVSKAAGLARANDNIVVTAGVPLNQAGSTNLLKVEKVT
jgi:pyruvate kinase